MSMLLLRVCIWGWALFICMLREAHYVCWAGPDCMLGRGDMWAGPEIMFDYVVFGELTKLCAYVIVF